MNVARESNGTICGRFRWYSSWDVGEWAEWIGRKAGGRDEMEIQTKRTTEIERLCLDAEQGDVDA